MCDDMIRYDDMYVWDVMLHYDMNILNNEMYDMYDNDEFFDAELLSNVMNDVMYESLQPHE